MRENITSEQWQSQKASAARAGHFEIVNAMDAVERGDLPNLSELPDLGEIAKHLQANGVHQDTYSYLMPLVYEYLEFPLWEESGIRAVRRLPWLPSSVLFFGAYLDPALLKHQYGLAKSVVDMAPGVLVMHPETRVLQIRSGVGAISNRKGNQPAIASFNADFIARNSAAGRTTVLVGCQDRAGNNGLTRQLLATEAIEAVRDALRQRGLGDIAILSPGDALPETPSSKVVPFISYSSIGTNDYESYDAVCFVNSFNVPADEVRNMAFPERKPAWRPRFIIGRRRKIIPETPMTREEIEHVRRVLHRMEVEPLLQAAHRVRFAVHPRTVVLCSQHDLRPQLGRVTVVPNITACRKALGMETVMSERRQQYRQRGVAILRQGLQAGMTLSAATKAAGISYSTARLWAAEEGLPVPRQGRPRRSA